MATIKTFEIKLLGEREPIAQCASHFSLDEKSGFFIFRDERQNEISRFNAKEVVSIVDVGQFNEAQQKAEAGIGAKHKST